MQLELNPNKLFEKLKNFHPRGLFKKENNAQLTLLDGADGQLGTDDQRGDGEDGEDGQDGINEDENVIEDQDGSEDGSVDFNFSNMLKSSFYVYH